MYNVFKISGATLYDHVAIKANVRAMYREKYHCEQDINNIEKRILAAKDDKTKQTLKKQIELVKNHKGCGTVLKRPIEIIDNVEYRTCLCSIKHPMINDLWVMEKQYSLGNLPFSGGMLDQPAQVIELIELVQDAKMKEEIERQKCQTK